MSRIILKTDQAYRKLHRQPSTYLLMMMVSLLIVMLCLVQAPYQVKLIDVNALVPDEIDWLNTYHSKCRDILAPFLDECEMAWLKKATEPISA